MSRGSARGNRRAAIVGLLLAGGAVGAGGDLRGQTPRVTIEPDTTEIHVGDPLALRLAVEHPADFAVRWPDSLSLGSFEALALEVGPSEASAAGARTAAVLHVTAFELGELEIPSFTLELSDGGEGMVTVSTDPVVIGVTTVGLDEGGDIRDVKGPRAIARDWLLLWPWFLLAVALAGLGYWWGRRRRRHPDRTDSRPPVPARPAHEIALEALDRLEASPLLERGEIKPYHIEVSRIIRAYLEGRYRIWALEMVTPDVISSLGHAGVDPGIRTAFERFLEACDLVKFAKWRPDDAACRSILADARTLVERTRFVPPPAVVESEAMAAGAEAAADERSEAAVP
ncbi:MAG: hypothetical protein OXI39_11920 [Gemmatimonadota bacterium]|uniref:hypothetical protein n=1 Tax=Candidatus Palauibacter scopulicola TaxID=3056741 RepID=UPI00239D37DA|nr:hypothetical protein [Candidatus Palauibacter scopulicola]MDE2663696.1 hypothetical protein [Candidatus Palauibacter scopulicola]